MTTVFIVVKEMIDEAESLENDDLVSMAEGACNYHIAKKLRKYGARLLIADNPVPCDDGTVGTFNRED